MELSSDKILNEQYRLLQRIGSGGFSVVWLAEAIDDNTEQYAIKIYAPQQGLNPEDIMLFEAEYERLSTLSHQHIIETKGYFKIDESPCLVLKYCAGGSLHRRIKQTNRLSETELATLMVHIGGALHYLHTLPVPIYHLDLKPDNILIDEDQYILTDFGISNEVRNTMLRRSSVVAETFSYRSPERALNHNLSDKHDVFSFGVVLLECCNGFFDPKFSIADSVLNGHELPLLEGYPKRLTDIVHQIISLYPDDRPTAMEIQNFGLYYLEHKFWPAIDKAQKTRRNTPVWNSTQQEISAATPAAAETPRWYFPVILATVLICAAILVYVFVKIGNQQPQKQQIAQNDCEALSVLVDQLFKRGKFSSVANLSARASNLCAGNADVSDKIDKSVRCLSFLAEGDRHYQNGYYEEAGKAYNSIYSCGCPDDSTGVAKAHLKVITDQINTEKLLRNSINKIEKASNPN